MLASGADVSIGGVEYILDHSQGPGCVHRYESLFAQTTAIAGEIAKQQLRPEKMLWSWTNWTGGEGYPIYYPEDPTTYDIGSGLNTTIPGLVTTRTRRYRTSVARSGTPTVGLRPAGGSTWDKAIILWGSDGLFSKDGIGWSAGTGTANTATYQYFDADSDGRYMVVGVLHEGATTDILPAADGVTPAYADLFTGTTLLNPPIVTEVLGGNWYGWGIDGAASNVLALVKGATLATTSVGTLIYNSGIVPNGAWGNQFWTDIESAESGLYMSFGTPSGSVLFEVIADVGNPFWTTPPGFCIKKLVYQEGVLFCLGAQTSAGKRFATIYAIPLATRAPINLGSPRRHKNTELGSWEVAAAGSDSKLFMADCDTGKIFTYDLRHESFALFDDLANAGTGDGTTFTSYTNLLPLGMSTFESGDITTSGWTQEAGTVAVVSNAAFAARSGNYSLGNSATYTASTPTGVGGIPVASSTSYTAFAYARGSGSGGAITIGIRWYNAAGTLLSTDTSSSLTPLTTSYQQFSTTATSPSTAAYATLVVIRTSAGVTVTVDDVVFHAGSGVAGEDRIASMFMHGSRLVVATWQPQGSGTSLQVLTYEDLVKENRDASQSISGSVESGEWDFGVPQEQKALIGFYVNYEVTDSATTSGLLANSRITISYATDSAISATPTYTALTTITSATTVTAKGRHFIAVSSETTTTKFTRLKMKITLDNNSSAVAPPILYSLVAEAQLMAYTETWELSVKVQDEKNSSRPRSRENDASFLRDNLLALATNKALVTFLDGSRYPSKHGAESSTHTVTVEDPTDIVGPNAEGTMRLKLRAVPA